MTTASKQTSTTSMIIDGVAASEAIDSSGEILDVKGCDTSDFENGVGLLNYEHRGDQAQGASGNDIVGKIIYSKKVYKKADCEGKRQEAYWDHVKLPFIYIKARLYDGAEHPGALALAAAIRDAVMHTEPILLRFSIEGTTLKKEGNRLLRTIGRKVALTFKPANKSAISGLISDPSGPKPISEKQGEKSLLSRLLEDDTSKSEAPGHQHLGSYEMAYNPIVEEDSVGLLKNAADAIRDLRLDTYKWHPIEYNFLIPIDTLHKGEFDFDQMYKPAHLTLGTNKLRQLRDYLLDNNMQRVNERDPRLPEPIRQALAHTGRDYEGNFSVSRIQKLIDEKPKLRFNQSADMGVYNYIQRHNDLKQNVFRLNLTTEQAARLEAAGVMGSFMNMHKISIGSQHPVQPGTIGWVRWTGGKDGIHIDEVQSDYGRKWSALIEHQLGKEVAEGRFSPEDAARKIIELNQQLPDEHLKIIQKTLFGNKQPAEILHEGFHQWARDNNFAGTPVHVWAPGAKAAINGMDQHAPLPGHYIVTYKDIPEKYGMEPAKYGELPTQDNKSIIKAKRKKKDSDDEIEWKGSNETFKDKIRKTEELLKTYIGGMTSGAPSTLEGGAALQREDDRLHQHDFKNKLRSAIRDMGVEVVGKSAMLKFFKWQLPEVNETFLDHFTDLVSDIKARPAVLDSLMAKWEMPMAKATRVPGIRMTDRVDLSALPKAQPLKARGRLRFEPPQYGSGDEHEYDYSHMLPPALRATHKLHVQSDPGMGETRAKLWPKQVSHFEPDLTVEAVHFFDEWGDVKHIEPHIGQMGNRSVAGAAPHVLAALFAHTRNHNGILNVKIPQHSPQARNLIQKYGHLMGIKYAPSPVTNEDEDAEYFGVSGFRGGDRFQLNEASLQLLAGILKMDFLSKTEEGVPTEAPATEAKPEKPKRPKRPKAPKKEKAPAAPRATRPKKVLPPLPLPVEQYQPTPEAQDPRNAPPQGKSNKGIVDGVLYTPNIQQGIALHNWGADETMQSIIHADDPGRSPNLTSEQRENIVKYVHTPWARAMKSWRVMNKMAEAGMLPPSIIAHAAIFAAMSPNTSVPIQELYFGHYMDFRRLHPDLFTNPAGVSPEDAIAFHNHMNSLEAPEFFPSYYQGGPGTMKYGAERSRPKKGTKAWLDRQSAVFEDRPQGKPLLNYHKVHPLLMALHRQTKSDGRSFVDYIMQQKDTHGAGSFMYGFGPKLARYMGLMLGMGNMIVPDRHMMRSLFNLSLAQKEEFKSVAATLSKIEGERFLRAVDKHFLENNPAVKKAHSLYPDHFDSRPEQAVGPGFWLHWLAYPHYEQMLGRPTENANSGTAHDPFWRAIPQILNEEGIPHDFQEPDEPWLKKAIADSTGIPERVARATKRVQDMFGEGAASLFFHSYGVPALLHNDKMSRLDGQHVRKAEYEALEEVSLIKREYAAVESARLCKTIDFNGVDEIYTVDGDTQHGRFWVKDGNLRILEDHEGVLRGRIHNGPVADNKDGIERMVMEGHRIKVEAPIEEGKEIELGQLAEDQIKPGGAPDVIEDPHMEDAPVDIEDMGASAHRPPPIFDFMLVGSSRPTVVEIHGQEIFENGSKLEQDDADWMLHQIHIGRATLRYHEGLAKSAPEVRQAMTGLHAAAKAGHIKPEHADAIRRGLFTDRLSGGHIGNRAAHEDFIEGQKGKPQGVHLHMDANDFGSINKMHGHPVGDQAIKTMANIMRETMDKHVGRKNGKLFRVGGDEFKAHFQTPAHASVFARALRQNLDQLVPVGGTHRISLSMGMGHSPEHAEQALMNAKDEKKAQNYPVGQAEHHVHSLLSGHEGSIPVASSPVPKLHLQPR